MNAATQAPRFSAAVGFLCLLSALMVSSCARADRDQTQALIRVSSEGIAALAPDMAVLNLTVTREAKTAEKALDENSQAMEQVLEAMQDEGVAERDLQTANFSIQPKYYYPSNNSRAEREPPKIVGYTVRNSLTVRVRDIDSVGEILDLSIKLGVNEGGNIRFINDDPSEALRQARVEAVKSALQKAETLADAAGVELGPLIEISEQSYSPRPQPMARADMMMSRAAESVPIATGENNYRVTVNITVAIDQ